MLADLLLIYQLVKPTFIKPADKTASAIVLFVEQPLPLVKINYQLLVNIRVKEIKKKLAQKPIIIPKRVIVPSPSPTPRPVRPAAEELRTLFLRFGEEYQVSWEILEKIAYRESKYNSQAINGPYVGLFQFTDRTWTATRNSMGMDPNLDLRLSPEEAIRTAAFKISRGGIRAWPACSKVL